MKKSWFFFGLVFTIMACSTDKPLDVISIEIDDKLSWEEKRRISIDYIHDGDTLTFPAKAKFRGGSSSAYYKHSFSVELDNNYPLCDLPSDDDWVFNASYIDKTLMRHKICFDLYKEMSPRNIAPSCAYFNLYISDKYEGLYVLMEKVNAGFLGLNEKDSMAMLFKDPPVFRKDRATHSLFPENPYDQKFPELASRNMTHHLDSLQSFLLHANQSELEKNIADIIDINNIIDWHLLLLYSNNGDGIVKNFYLYKIDENSPFRIAIWDYDHSFGRDGDNEMNLMKSPLDCNISILFTRLMEWPEYQNQLSKRYKELRSTGIFSVKKMKLLIDENDMIIGHEIDRNFEKWPIDDKWYFDQNDYQQEKELILRFVKLSLEQLDERFGYLN